jgi:PAS domain S-box-containing protein
MKDESKTERQLAVEVAALRQRIVELEAAEIERQRAAEALRVSEEKFAKAFRSSPDSMVISTIADGRYIEVNDGFSRITGYRREEVIGRTSREMKIWVDPEDRATFVRMLQAQGAIRNLEMRFRKKSGEIGVALVSAEVIELGGTPCFLTVTKDITERKRTEKVQAAIYRVSEAALAASTLDGLFRSIHDITSELMPAKNFYIALFDAATDTLSFPYFVDEHDTAPPPRKCGRGLTEYVLRTGEPLLAPPEVHRALMEQAEAELIGAPAVDWLGVPLKIKEQPIGVLVVQSYTEGVRFGEEDKEILRFVSTQVAMAIERKRGEEELRESQRFIQQIADATPNVLYLYNLGEQQTVYVNRQATVVLGRTPEEIQRMGAAVFQILLHPDDLAQHAERLKRFNQAQDGEIIETEYRMRHANGEWRWLYSRDTVFRRTADGSPQLILGAAQDITEHKHLEEQLRHSQRMEAVGRLAGGVAHDFNNLLTVISGYSELILNNLGPGDPRRGYVEEIRRAGARAAALTRQLLAFSRQQVMQPKVLNLNAVVANMEKMLRRLIGEDIELATMLAPDLGQVKADPGQIEQVILNLAVNARDAMPDGGRLTLETANVHLDMSDVRSDGGVPTGRYVMLAVSDTGCGMDALTRSHIFEPFFTTKAQGKGTGLGLSTVYGIVTQSGGHIWVESEPGRGATFKIYLPQVSEVVEMMPQRNESSGLPRGTETVLLVEDDPSVREWTARVLGEQGYVVLETANGDEALRVAQNYAQDQIRLLLTDVIMPQMSGSELARRLTALRPGMKVLYLSGYMDDTIINHGVLNAGAAFLQKPYSSAVLAQKVRDVLDNQRAVRDS